MNFYEKPFDNFVAFIMLLLVFSMLCSAWRVDGIQSKENITNSNTQIIERQVARYNDLLIVRSERIAFFHKKGEKISLQRRGNAIQEVEVAIKQNKLKKKSLYSRILRKMGL